MELSKGGGGWVADWRDLKTGGTAKLKKVSWSLSEEACVAAGPRVVETVVEYLRRRLEVKWKEVTWKEGVGKEKSERWKVKWKDKNNKPHEEK